MTQGLATATMDMPLSSTFPGVFPRMFDQLTQRTGEHADKETSGEIDGVLKTPLLRDERKKTSTRPSESVAAAEKPFAASSGEYLVGGEQGADLQTFTYVPVTRPSPAAQSIIRNALAKPILADLQSIQQYARRDMAAAYAAPLLKTMRTMRDLVPYDPYVKVVMALYDAMAFENKWADYNVEQYQGAQEILRQLAKRTNVDRQSVAKAILGLDELGFNTTPFGMPDSEED